MTENSAIMKIKTQLSEVEKEVEKRAEVIQILMPENSGIIHNRRRHLDKFMYACPMCQRDRVGCPCGQGQQKHLLGYTFNKNKQNERKERVQVNRSMHQVSRSVPKITFTYNVTEQQRPRTHSFSIPKAVPVENRWILKETTTTAVSYPVEEIIYYPVVCNRFKYESPKTEKDDNAGKKQMNSSRKRIKRSYIDNSIRVMKDLSTNESKQPMTPEQFKKLSEWLLQH